MNETTVTVGLDPATVINNLSKVSDETRKLAVVMEESLGKKAVKSVAGLEDAAERGTNKIAALFRNLSSRVRADLKTAFDATGILAGAKFANEIGQGVKQVAEMDRAFDRLNTRLGLSVKQLTAFKNEVGRKVAATGQKLEDVLPGVEVAASRGGVKSPAELAGIAESLAKARTITGEQTEPLSESIVEILKSSNQKVTGKSFQETLDTVEATRKNGAFKTANEAANAIEEISPYAKQLHMSTRESGGLVATASRSGAAGQNILKQLLDHATTPGGMAQINAMLGQQVFKNGHLDQKALAKVDTHRFGQYSQQILGQQFSGANGGDLDRFINSFKDGMDSFDAVVKGTNETSAQFEIASNNFATSIAKMKEKTKEASREIADAVAKMGNDIVTGNFKNLKSDAVDVGTSVNENKGTVIAAAAVTAIVSLLAGGGINNILKKIPGGGVASGIVSAETAKAGGVTPVFVTNASQIGCGGSGVAGAAGFGGKAGINLNTAGGVLIAAAGGIMFGEAVNDLIQAATGNRGWIGDKTFDITHSDDTSFAENKQRGKNYDRFNSQNGGNISPAAYAEAVKNGTLDALKQHAENKPHYYTNPSAVTGRGGGM